MSDYMAKVYADPVLIDHGDAVHYKPDNAIKDADLGYEGALQDTLDNRLQFFDGVFAGASYPGIVPDPVTETGKFLKDDGTWDSIDESLDESLDYVWTGTHTFEDIEYSNTYWEDLRVPVGVVAVQGASNTPDWETFVDNLQILCFSASTMEQVFFTVQIPHSWKEGTDIEAHVHWAPAAAGGAEGHRARWGLEYTWGNIGATLPSSSIIYGSADITPDEQLVQNRHYVTELGDIDGTGKTISSVLICRLFRDATHDDDDFTGDACLLEIDFHYEIDRPGSREEYVK